MNSAEKKLWLVVLAEPAHKSLRRISSDDRARIRLAIDAMEENPLLGDVPGGAQACQRVGPMRHPRESPVCFTMPQMSPRPQHKIYLTKTPECSIRYLRFMDSIDRMEETDGGEG
jgi:hypothetical protein